MFYIIFYLVVAYVLLECMATMIHCTKEIKTCDRHISNIKEHEIKFNDVVEAKLKEFELLEISLDTLSQRTKILAEVDTLQKEQAIAWEALILKFANEKKDMRKPIVVQCWLWFVDKLK